MRSSQPFRRFLVGCFVSGVLAASGPAMPPLEASERPKTPPDKQEAQETKQTKKPEGSKRESAASSNPDERGRPQAVDFETSDGVIVSATYFPPLRPDKSTPVVLMLHGYGEKRSVFWPTSTELDLPFALQDKGYAVLTLDFRGHGKSTSRAGTPPGTPQKGPASSGKLDYTEFRNAAHFKPLLQDIEAAKRFLVRRNNAGEINIARLGVIGTEMGASLAVLWSYGDWQYTPQSGFAASKQGQDVQALVLVSPVYNFKGLAISKELAWLQSRVPIQVVVGTKDNKAFADADKIFQSAKRALPAGNDSRLAGLEVKLQGSKLLNPEHELDVHKEIISFLETTLKNKKRAVWEAREISDDEDTGQ